MTSLEISYLVAECCLLSLEQIEQACKQAERVEDYGVFRIKKIQLPGAATGQYSSDIAHALSTCVTVFN